MGYIKAEEILPLEIIEIIQKYVDGQSIYIPRKENNRVEWGSMTETKKQLCDRNKSIYEEFVAGKKVAELAQQYYLSEKSIQRIVRKMKV